jgi:hypothetical protein
LVLNPIRLNWHYVVWYKNFFVTLVSVIVPFILLLFWNYYTCKTLLRRNRSQNAHGVLSNSTTNNHSKAAKLFNGNITNKETRIRSFPAEGIKINLFIYFQYFKLKSTSSFLRYLLSVFNLIISYSTWGQNI